MKKILMGKKTHNYKYNNLLSRSSFWLCFLLPDMGCKLLLLLSKCH